MGRRCAPLLAPAEQSRSAVARSAAIALRSPLVLSTQVEAGMTVFAHYTGKLENGQVFDSTAGKPHRQKHGFYFTPGAGEVIAGWDVGFGSMSVGEKAVLTLRHDYAYGEGGMPAAGIPPAATLVFEVELIGARVVSAAERQAIDQEVASLR